MRFNNGYFGACVVVLAILGTALGGFVLSLERTVEPVTNFEYITDVSGLFSYTNEPEYVDYNPSTNYVGYTADTGQPKYTQTTTANNYRYVVSEGSTWNQTYTFTQSKQFGFDYATNHGWVNYNDGSNVGPKFLKWIGNEFTIPNYQQYNGVQYQGLINIVNNSYNPQYVNVASLQSVLTDMASGQAGYKSAEIDLTQTGTYPVFFYAGNWHSIGGISPGAESSDDAFDNDNVLPDKLIVDGVTLTVKAYKSGDLIWESLASNVAVISHYRISGSGFDDASVGVTFDVTYTGYPVYAYMNPNDGVSIDNDVETSGFYAINWTNGYENDSVTFKVVGEPNENLAMVSYAGAEYSQQFSIEWMPNGTVYFYYDLYGAYHPYVLGVWPAVQITLYASENKIVVTPTTDTSMLTVVDEQPYSFTLADYLKPGEIDKIQFKDYLLADGTSPTASWQITNTSVFLNTYNTVMKDPTLNIQTYFPGLNEYRLNFYAFAIYGDSVTINGNVGTVDRSTGLVTFTINGQTVIHPLKNIYVSTDADNTYLTFADLNKTYDLGATTSHTVSFSGYWYFTTGLYEPVEGLQTVYEWDLDGTFHANAGQCLIIFLGIMALCVLVGKTFGGVNVRIFDWLVMIFAGFLAFSILGGMIV